MAASRGQPVCRKEDCSPYDIGTVFTTIGRFTDDAKFRFIENLWKPKALYVFHTSVETSGSLRKFRLEWFAHFMVVSSTDRFVLNIFVPKPFRPLDHKIIRSYQINSTYKFTNGIVVCTWKKTSKWWSKQNQWLKQWSNLQSPVWTRLVTIPTAMVSVKPGADLGGGGWLGG